MYLFRLQPMVFDSYKWQAADAYSVLTPTESSKFYDDTNKTPWQPFTSGYYKNTCVRRGQYLYYSARGKNTDDPYYNWIGSLPQGNDTWIKGRCLHDYDCINTLSPGATQRVTTLSIRVYPRKMALASDISQFYGEEAETYLILSGLRSDTVTVAYYDASDVLISTTSVVSGETPSTRKRIIRDRDSFAEPYLPAILKDTIFSVLPETARRIDIDITPGSGIISKIQQIAFGKAYKIGHTEGKELNLGAVDYTRINYDDWGKMSLIKGKAAKTLSVSLPVIGHLAKYEEKILRLLQATRATPVIFHGVNNIVTNTFVSSLAFICGILKSASVSEVHTNKRTLDIQVDGIPTDYNP